MILKRQAGLKRKLSKDPALCARYNEEISMLVKEGYAEKVNKIDINAYPGLTWYLSIFNVVNPNKPEKFRLVHNAAAIYHNESLNMLVKSGPDLGNKLIDILLRFRKEQIAVTADIKAMFFQVKVTPEHQHCLRFLWWPEGDLSKEPEIYFGGVWSPCAAMYALRRCVIDATDSYSEEVIQSILNDTYIDNLIHSLGPMSEDPLRYMREVCGIVGEGGFFLRDFASNEKKLLEAIPEERRTKSLKSFNFEEDGLPKEQILGMIWEPEVDKLSIRITMKEKPYTKRGLLSMLSSVYDPTGLVNPFIVQAKILFQNECKRNISWDDPILAETEVKWKKWLNDLSALEGFSINRCFKPLMLSAEVIRVELHHFCDASELCYGAVTYIRLEMSDGSYHCSFIMAKSRLAPMKGSPIPRLELCGATVAVKLDVVVIRSLQMTIDKRYFWTDSTINLYRIRNAMKRFKIFVANRLATIHNSTKANQWHYIPSSENPADELSRGVDALTLKESKRWRDGPAFLWTPEGAWPKYEVPCNEDVVDPEIRNAQFTSLVKEKEENLLEKLFAKYSHLHQLLKGVAWLRKFCQWIRNEGKVQNKEVGPEDLREAELAVVKYVQKENYSKEYWLLLDNKAIPKASNIYKLEPFMNNGIIRAGGRLQNSAIPISLANPMIIPKDHAIAELIVRAAHKACGHSGREYTLSTIRESYWIPQVRSLVNECIRKCVWCKRYRGAPQVQRMANLPDDRTTPGKYAFSNVGVDCFGPFLVKRARSTVKRYGCLFTCLVTRAIHIEKLANLSSDSFINGLVRFMVRRGVPEIMRSDNGTNFVGGLKAFSVAMEELSKCKKIQSHLQMKNVKWIFNPPYASHMGGAWERMIRTVRKVLCVLIHKQVVDDEKLETFFCEVEAIVNGRPLTKNSDDVHDIAPLTPNHLLLLRPGPMGLLARTSKDDVFNRRWRHVQHLADNFWKAWLKQYLPSLQQRTKWDKPSQNVEVGDIVLLRPTSLVTAGLWQEFKKSSRAEMDLSEPSN